MSNNFTRRNIVKNLLDNPQFRKIKSNNENLNNGDLQVLIDIMSLNKNKSDWEKE